MAILSDAGKVVAHAHLGGAGNTTRSSARAAAPQRSLQGGIWSDITHGVGSAAHAVENTALGTASAIGHSSVDSWLHNPAVNMVTFGIPGLAGNLEHPMRTAQQIPGAIERFAGAGVLNTLFPGMGSTMFGWPSAAGSKYGPGVVNTLSNAGQGLWNAFGFGGGDTKPPATVAKKPPPINLGPGTNTGGGTTGVSTGGAPQGPDATSTVMKGIGSESLVPQPTYQTVPTIGYNQVSPHYTQPYSFWTDPNAFDIPPEAVSQIDPNTLPVVSVPPINNVPQVSPSFIDLNSLPSVNVPQMSAADATAAGNLLSTGLNLQTPDWNSLIKGAGAMAASQYGPMVQSIAQQAKNAANTIQGYTQGAQGVLQDTARDINQSYAQSIAAQKGLDQGIVNMMSAANPNAVQQPMLNAQGIDPTTQAQIQAQNNQSFNAGGAALGSIGQLNANSLLAQSAAVQNYVRSIRPQIAIGGQQALQNVATGASSDLAKVATQEAKDAWQMAKDMGASDQKAGAAYQNAFNTTMSNFYKGAGLDVSAQGKNQATALSAGKTNVGTDITAQKANQTTDLAGQKANQATDLAGQKANQAVDYGAAKANASEANSILKGNQSAGTRIATIDMTTAAGIEKLNVTNDLNAKIHNQGAALSADKANQNAIVQNNYHNAQIYMQGVKTAISAQQAATSRGRLALELYKVTHPTASASAVASAGKSARSFFAPAAGYVPMSYATVPHTNPNTGAITHDRVPIYSHMTYEQMIQNFAESNGGTQDAYSYATNVANSYVNPGYKGRPLDADMANALSQANIDPTIQQTNKGVPYLTQQQAQYLNDNGFASFTHYLDQVPHYENGVHDRVFVIPPLMGAPPPQVTQAAG